MRPLQGRPLPDLLPRVPFRPGEVVLVGAGPGDRDLLTLRACAYLREADSIFYDKQVDRSAFRWAPRRAVRIAVPSPARRGRAKVAPRWEEQLVERARSGERVVRWMHGDPLVLGDGLRTLARLASLGVPATVVPGLSPLTAAPTLASLPLFLESASESCTLLHLPLSKSDLRPRGRSARPRAFGPRDTVVAWIGETEVLESLLSLTKVVAVTSNAALIGAPGTDQGWVLRASLRLLVREVRRRHLVGPLLVVVGRVAGGDLLPPPGPSASPAARTRRRSSSRHVGPK